MNPQQLQLAPAQAQHRLSLEIVRSVIGLRELRNDWRELEARDPRAGIFVSWDWCCNWRDNFGECGSPYVLVARDPVSQEAKAIAPFLIRRWPARYSPIRELSFLGCTAASPDHLDLLSGDSCRDDVARQIARRIHEDKPADLIRLDGMASESALVAALEAEAGSRPQLSWETVCPFGRLPETWDEYQRSLTRKLRLNLRRQERRLSTQFPPGACLRTIKRPHELEQAMSDLFRLHRLARQRHGQVGAFSVRRVRTFHRQLARQLLRSRRLRLQFLEVDDQRIAVMYGFQFEKTVSFYQTGFDPEWATYGPGVSMFAAALRSAIEDGLSHFDFLRGDESYKYDWTNNAPRRGIKWRLGLTRQGDWLVRGMRLALTARRRLWSGRS